MTISSADTADRRIAHLGEVPGGSVLLQSRHAGVDSPAEMTQAGGFGMRTWCCELELASTEGVRSVLPRPAGAELVRVLVRLHGTPLGYIERATLPDPIDAAALRVDAFAECESRVRAQLTREGFDAAGVTAGDLQATESHDALPWP